jgi:uncharacterized membrane protein
MGQGHWIKESDGHYKHYTEEEYQKSPRGIAERISNYIFGIVIILAVIGIIISIIVGIIQWLISLF